MESKYYLTLMGRDKYNENMLWNFGNEGKTAVKY